MTKKNVSQLDKQRILEVLRKFKKCKTEDEEARVVRSLSIGQVRYLAALLRSSIEEDARQAS